MLHDNQNRYGIVTRFLHWSIAILVLWNFLRFANGINDGENWITQTLVKPFHSSIGLLIFVLVVIRIIWMLVQRKNRPAPLAYPKLAKAGHHAMYLFLFLTPLTAMIYLVGRGVGLKFFDYQIIAGGEKSQLLIDIGHLHGPFSIVLGLLIVGHIAMALYHKFVLKDATVSRMIGK